MSRTPDCCTIPQEQAEALCAAWLEGGVRIVPLYGEFDLNYRVATDRGQRFVLKIMRDDSAETRSLVELQLLILGHLARRPLGVECPCPVPLRSGEWTREVVDAAGRRRVAWMLTWVDGNLLDDLPVYGDRLLLELGRSVAEIDRALLDLQEPLAERKLMWDLARASELRDHVRWVADLQRREIVERSFRRFDDRILQRLAERPRSIIHNDGGNQHNMIVRGEGASARVAGIIDFGDSVATQTVCGLGIAAAYATFGRDDPAEAMARVAAGYDRVLRLEDPDLELLPSLAAIRLTVSVCVAARRAADDATDAYAVVSAAPAWKTLERLHADGIERAADVIGEFVHATR